MGLYDNEWYQVVNGVIQLPSASVCVYIYIYSICLGSNVKRCVRWDLYRLFDSAPSPPFFFSFYYYYYYNFENKIKLGNVAGCGYTDLQVRIAYKANKANIMNFKRWVWGELLLLTIFMQLEFDFI